MSLPEGVLALFVTSFEPGVGNSIVWKHLNTSNDKDLNLYGLEYTSMPSGMHLVNSDEIYFTTKDDNHGIALYRKISSSKDRDRGASMFSVGVITRDTYTPYDYLPELEEVSLYLVTNPPSDDLPDLFFTPIQTSDNARVTQQSPSPKALAVLLDTLGPLLLLLFRLLLAQKRVVIFFRPTDGKGVGWISAALKSLTEILNDDYDGLANEKRTRYIGNVGLIDLERLESVKRGYIASTTDALLLEKPQVYDAIIDLSPKVKYPSLYMTQRGEQGVYISRQTYTLGDLYIWRKLRSSIDSKTLATSPPYGLVDLLADMWSYTFQLNRKLNIAIPSGHSEYDAQAQAHDGSTDSNDDQHNDEDDQVRLIQKSLNPSPAIVAFMKNYSSTILANLLTLALRPDHDYNSNENVRDDDLGDGGNDEDTAADAAADADIPLQLSAADLIALGLSPLSDIDSIVAESISLSELGRNASVSVGYAWSLCSFVRRQCLSIGWI